MKIIFFGTPEYVLPVLVSIHKSFKSRSGETPIAAVVTQNPRPSGRDQQLKYSEIDHWAHKHRVPKFYNSNSLLKENIYADVGVLAAYGEIIPKAVIDLFPHGIINIHPSLLPKFRGASPVQSVIFTGEDTTGVSFVKMDEALDHGPIISHFKEKITPSDTTESLRNRLFARSSEVVPTLLPAYLKGKTSLKPQDHKSATFTSTIRKDHALIDPEALKAVLKGEEFSSDWKIPFIKDYQIPYSPDAVHNFIRAMQPWPVAWTYVLLTANGDQSTAKRLKLIESSVDRSPNAISLNLKTVQLEGKNPVSWKQFTEAYPDYKFTDIN